MMRKIAFLLVFLFSTVMAFSQTRTIKGKVIDESGAGLPGATVQLKGTQKGSVTDVDGNYSIAVPTEGGALVVSYVGYTNQEVTIGQSDEINVNLALDVQNLEQVVVVGYGVQKKSLVTGSISKIESKDITAMPATRVEQALQGKTSGVYIAQSSGTPGGAMSIKIRGNSSDGKNDPIYIVDGIKTGSIDFLAPNDIESIEILKDAASCAIYGAEGGNGVVIISTKKGSSSSSIVEYKYQHGWQNVANTIKMMDASQYVKYQKEASLMEKNTKNYAKVNALDSVNGTNWMDQIFNQAPSDEHSILISSGSEKATYLLSGSYLTQDGIVGGSKNNYTRYTFRFSGDAKVKKWLSVGSNVAYTQSEKQNLTDNSDFFGGVITSALYFDPTVPVYYNDTAEVKKLYRNNEVIIGSMVKKGDQYFHNSTVTTGDVANPMAMIENTHNTTTTNKILGDVHASLFILDGLKFNSTLGLDYALRVDNVFSPKWYYDDTNLQTNDTLVTIQSTYTKFFKYSFENYLSFDRTFGDHSFSVMAGMSYENSKPTFLYVQGNRVPYGQQQFAYVHNVRNNPNPGIDGGIGTRDNYDNLEIQNSYFGRIGYNYKERYMLQANFRRDGSSLFGSDNIYGFFPSFSAGWNIARESFFADNVSLINTLKLRASWGQNGNKQILQPFGYTSVMTVETSYALTDGTFAQGAFPYRPGNPVYKWETSQSTDVGLDIGILKNRITIGIDYFDKRTKDQLGEMALVYDLMGYNNKPYENRGEVKNNGFEFDISYRENEKEFKYSITANASYLKNKVISYGVDGFRNGYQMNTGDFITRYEANQPVWYFRGYKAIGIFQDTAEINHYGAVNANQQFQMYQKSARPGDVKFADVASTDENGKVVMTPDGKIDDADKVNIGDPNPDFIFGLNFSCEFKGFDFGMFWNGVTGNQIFFAAFRGDRGAYNKPEVFFTERWTGPGTSNKYPRATFTDKNGNLSASTLNISDGDYIRLKSLSLGYTLPNNLTSKIGISKLRIYGVATNLLTLTSYKGTDPEIGQMDMTTNNSIGVDRGLYPSPQTFTVGVNVNF
jgi:TonB-linked SusC/RagA family outer membrane protein